MVTLKKTKPQIDYSTLVVVLVLLGYGLIALYSASTVQSFSNFGNTSYYIKHQLLYGALPGLLAMYLLSKTDYHIWQKYLPFLIGFALLSLLAVKIPGLGTSLKGAHRWVDLGPFTFQPAEVAKLVLIFYIASWVDKKRQHINEFYFGLLPSLCIVALFSALIMWQPDLGTMVVLLGVAATMLFVAGIKWRYLFWSALAAGLTLYLLIKIEPYRAKRLVTFLNPAIDPKGISYQINQALLAIGAGGLWGYGYGLSRQKHNYLPEVMTDSVFAVTSEELGFLRVAVIIALFAVFLKKGINIAKSAADTFGKMTAFGITAWISIQAIINIGAMVHLLPLTGIPLPFFSYGGTALIMNLAGVGVLLNISKQAKNV